MIVEKNETAGVSEDCRLVHFSWGNQRSVDDALTDKLNTAHLVLRVEMDRVESLTITRGETAEHTMNVCRASNTIRPGTMGAFPNERYVSSVPNPGVAIEEMVLFQGGVHRFHAR